MCFLSKQNGDIPASYLSFHGSKASKLKNILCGIKLWGWESGQTPFGGNHDLDLPRWPSGKWMVYRDPQCKDVIIQWWLASWVGAWVGAFDPTIHCQASKEKQQKEGFKAPTRHGTKKRTQRVGCVWFNRGFWSHKRSIRYNYYSYIQGVYKKPLANQYNGIGKRFSLWLSVGLLDFFLKGILSGEYPYKKDNFHN